MMETRWAYFIHLMAWAVPILLGQLFFLVRHYRHRSPEVLRAVLPPALVVGTWLAVTDHLAIREGIWNFGAGRHLGIYLGMVPLEEVLFFLMTSLMVSLGLALFTALLRQEAHPS